MSDPTEDERTDPNIALPDRASGPPSGRADAAVGQTVEHTMEVELPEAAPPPLPGREAQGAPPRSPSQPAARPRAPFPPAGRTPSAFPPAGRTPSGFPARPPSALPTSSPSSSEASRAPVPMRLGTIPPSRMPKPSDPPPPRAATSPPERQRIAQMETQLDQTLSAIAQKKSELDELRARLEEKEQRLDALLDRLPSEPGTAPARADGEPELDRRLRDLEQKKEEIARELRVRFSAQEEDTEKHIALLDTLSNRLQWLEEGEEAARIRMRLERVGHRLTGLESKLVEIAESQDDLRTEEAGRAARDRKWEARIERLESLFDEMADELRTQRDGSEVEALRARLEGVEALVLQTGSAEQALKLEVEALRGSIAPPPRSAPAEPPVKEAPVTSAAPSSAAPTSAAMSGDDLTRIKGVGPKFARQLRGLGITTFAQVAAWGADDVELIAAELGIKPTRIARAGWVKSAKALID